MQEYVGNSDADAEGLLQACLDDAAVLVNKYVGTATVPEQIKDRCILIAAYDLYERRNAPNGIANQQFIAVDGIPSTPARIARDPLAGVYPLLSRWVLPW